MSAAADISTRLGRNAEAVCRRYLSNGRRNGGYWSAGDVSNSAGRSLHVRLNGPESGPGAAGHWTDQATGDHGDLLDLIGLACGHTRLIDSLDEARAFLSLPRPEPNERTNLASQPKAPTASPEAARRLFAAGRPIRGTLAADYLRARGLRIADYPALRFHPGVYYRPDRDGPRRSMPALLAAVTDLDDRVVGLQRTWLNPATKMKADVDTPRRAMGALLGNGVRFGVANEVLAAGEGVETMLALSTVLPALPMVAALSASHLAALLLPQTLRRLYVARDPDPAGYRAVIRLTERVEADGIEVRVLEAEEGDFNDDLLRIGRAALLERVSGQLAPKDRARFAGLAVTEMRGGGAGAGSPSAVENASEFRSLVGQETAPAAF